MRSVRPLDPAAIAAAALLLAGCAADGAPAASPTPEATRIAVAVGDVLATATFPAGSPAQGGIEIVRGDGSWIVRAVGLTIPADAISDDPWFLTYGPTKADGCPTQTNWRIDLGTDARRDGGDWIVPDSFLDDPTFYDPTFIEYVGIRIPGAACGGLRYAVAPLEWEVAPLHPDWNGVDSGSRAGATGAVTDGVYLIADGDTTEGIEARFGLTAGQLDYLNPIGQKPAANPWGRFPKAGCTVNVEFDARWRFIECPS